jgi:lysophospholipid acyltransferase (LPLAT)-like uncharacterized protein
MLKMLGRSRWVQKSLGYLLAKYLKLVHATNTLELEPHDVYERVGPMPVIVAMWHGQHFMVHFARRPQDKVSALISRHRDGEFNAIALQHLDITPIRGSGAHGRKVREKGGASALRKMLMALTKGDMMVLTADVPKRARVCGMGVITLAKMSGRPIVPVAVVTSRRLQFSSWDRASIGLPFGRGVIVVGDPIDVPSTADDAMMTQIALHVERSLDEVHTRAYAKVGAADPGVILSQARDAERLALQRVAQLSPRTDLTAPPPIAPLYAGESI